MSIGALDAAAAYGRSISIGGGGKAPSAPTGPDQAKGAGSFSDALKRAVGDTADTLRTAEAESAKQVAGQGDLIDVVTAIGAAEVALDTMVAVRDKMVSAYTEIMRMQI